MATMVETATQHDVVTTKEELEAWKLAMARRRQGSGEPARPPALDPKRSGKGDWEDDINLLVAFLKGLRTIMDYLIKNRVPVGPDVLFGNEFSKVEQNINWAISDLYDVVNPPKAGKEHPCWIALEARELTGDSLRLKMAETDDRINNSPVPAVLERFDSILGSLIPVLYSLEPVKEFKEALESRIKHSGDRAIVTLNIFRDQQPWNK